MIDSRISCQIEVCLSHRLSTWTMSSFWFLLLMISTVSQWLMLDLGWLAWPMQALIQMAANFSFARLRYVYFVVYHVVR